MSPWYIAAVICFVAAALITIWPVLTAWSERRVAAVVEPRTRAMSSARKSGRGRA